MFVRHVIQSFLSAIRKQKTMSMATNGISLIKDDSPLFTMFSLSLPSARPTLPCGSPRTIFLGFAIRSFLLLIPDNMSDDNNSHEFRFDAAQLLLLHY